MINNYNGTPIITEENLWIQLVHENNMRQVLGDADLNKLFKTARERVFK